ncbi:hypothetical protein Dimus_011361 [Dionaea muscipula]
MLTSHPSHYIPLLRACRHLNQLLQIHARLVVLGLTKNGSNSSSHPADNPCVILYNTMVRAYTGLSQHDEALKLYHQVFGSATRPDKYTYTFVLKACTGKLAFGEGVDIHRKIVDEGLESDVFIATGLIDMYCKMGRLECARDLFDRMPRRDVVAWNAMIAGLSQSESPIDAVEFFVRMQSAGVEPNSVSLLNLFPAVCKLDDARLCRSVHGFVVRRDFRTAVVNGLIDLYSKCGCVDEARCIFDQMSCRDDVSWGTMMAGYAHNQYFDLVLELFDEMKRGRRMINKVSAVSASLAAAELRDLERGKEIHNFAKQQRIDSDTSVVTSLMTMYAKCGEFCTAIQLFQGLRDRDLVSWSALIAASVQCDYPDEALRLFREMVNEKLKPNAVTLISILPACSELSCLRLGKSIHCYAVKGGIDSVAVVGSALVSMYAKCLSFASALVICRQMSCKDTVTWNALINGYSQTGHPYHAIEMFYELRSSGMKPDMGTMVGVVPACALSHDLNQGTCFHGLIIKNGFQSDGHVKNALIDMYGKCERVMLAESVFDDADSAKDEVTWNVMISGYVQNRCSDKAIFAFCKMKSENMLPNEVSVVSVLPAIADLAALREGMCVHAYTIRMGLDSNTLICNSFIDMYHKCGRFDYSEMYFNEMENKDIVSWNAMLAGYAAHGQGDHAVSLFSLMQEHNNVGVDSVSFLCVLSACRHAGLVGEGREIFHSMKDEYHLEWQLEHYACMIDLLGRSGLFDEIMDLIKGMPMEPDGGVWGALLSACRTHSNVKLAEMALDHLVKLEPGNPAHYVGLSHIYAQSGRWFDATGSRLKLGDTGLTKVPGCSWV